MFCKKIAMALVLASAGLGFGTVANAATACVGTGYDISGKVVKNDGCLITDLDNDDATNVDGLFGEADWVAGGKVESFPGTNLFLKLTGDDSSGTWEILGATQPFKGLLAFKNGEGTKVVAYLIGMTTGPTGTYATPFVEPPFTLPGGSTSKEISHISFYYPYGSPPTGDVPLPGAVWLFGSALLGLVGLSRRRRAA